MFGDALLGALGGTELVELVELGPRRSMAGAEVAKTPRECSPGAELDELLLLSLRGADPAGL